MSNDVELSITIPSDMACMVKAWIITGQYTSESEAVLAGLHSLAAQKGAENRAIKRMLHDAVFPNE